MPKPIIIAGIETRPEDFRYFSLVSLFPNKTKIIFVVEMYRALSTLFAVGILDVNTREVSMITVIGGDIEEIIWSPDEEYIAYTLSSARGRGEFLSVDNVVEKRNIFLLNGAEIAKILGIENVFHFMPEFRNVRWSSDGKQLYFTTNSKISKYGRWEDWGKVEWVINADGSGLKKLNEIER